MTDKSLIDALVKCFLCPKFEEYYSGRWDVWLWQNGHLEEFKHLLLKRDEQLKFMLEQAKEQAKEMKNSPLWKALS